MAPRPILLRDAIAMSLARSDVVRVLNSSVSVASTTAYDAQIAESRRDGEFGAFDPRFKAEYEGTQIDSPTSSFFGPGIETETRSDEQRQSLFVLPTVLSQAISHHLQASPKTVKPSKYPCLIASAGL